ncbi:hypothetical protein CHS0354_018844 [Potamilus streckersoni]|uniref:Uncharacterized protein n=1 Tax=Potamilus streckersoni TaxID=2493646 RepID=A0AAE0VX93_9BIVA|nr:hypothetical protein CHS0354_018844 [Potamilus streckersoni]
MVERANRIIELSLSAFVSKNKRDWDEQIYLLMMAEKCSEHESPGVSSCEMGFGRTINLPVNLVLESHMIIAISNYKPTTLKNQLTLFQLNMDANQWMLRHQIVITNSRAGVHGRCIPNLINLFLPFHLHYLHPPLPHFSHRHPLLHLNELYSTQLVLVPMFRSPLHNSLNKKQLGCKPLENRTHLDYNPPPPVLTMGRTQHSIKRKMTLLIPPNLLVQLNQPYPI